MKRLVKRIVLSSLLLLCTLEVWAQQTLPYSYGFENNDLAAAGWTALNRSGSNASDFGITGIHSTTHSGNYDFRFASYYRSSNYNQYLFSPELATPHGLLVQFYYKTYEYIPEQFAIGYSTTDAAPGSFVWVDSIFTLHDWWTKSKEYVFPAGTKYVALNYYSPNKYFLDVDDFTFSLPTPCEQPSGLEISDIVADGATLSWTEEDGDSAQYQYVVVPHGETPDWTEATFVQADSVTLGGLNFDREYDFYVRRYCYENQQSESADTTFRTACGNISSLPWTEDFESGINCWTVGNVQDRNTGYYVPQVHEYGAHSGSNALFLSSLFDTYNGKQTNADSAYAVLPELDFDPAGCSMSLYARAYDDYTSFNQHLYVGIMDSLDENLNTFVRVADLELTTTYQPYEVSFASYQGTGRYIVLLATNRKDYDNWVLHGDFYVDDISITASAPATTLETNQSDKNTAQKRFVNRNLYIIQNGVVYDVLGRKLRK